MDDQINYDNPIEIAEGIYWVGYADNNAGLHCNPYLIIEGDEAILIDGGSRDDFSTVMMKILQTGIDPNQIERLIYQHYDPDLCGSIPHLENMIKNEKLSIISHHENNIFIKYYSSKKPKKCIEQMGMTYRFKTGRILKFYRTPYAHSTGSFMTYDEQTGTLFSSDIFGSYDRVWHLFGTVMPRCANCKLQSYCAHDNTPCILKGITDFHKRIMTSTKALNYALDVIDEINPAIIAPQHGSVINGQKYIKIVIKHLRELGCVGIDYFLKLQEGKPCN